MATGMSPCHGDAGQIADCAPCGLYRVTNALRKSELVLPSRRVQATRADPEESVATARARTWLGPVAPNCRLHRCPRAVSVTDTSPRATRMGTMKGDSALRCARTILQIRFRSGTKNLDECRLRGMPSGCAESATAASSAPLGASTPPGSVRNPGGRRSLAPSA